jgi:hypothetical protein
MAKCKFESKVMRTVVVSSSYENMNRAILSPGETLMRLRRLPTLFLMVITMNWVSGCGETKDVTPVSNKDSGSQVFNHEIQLGETISRIGVSQLVPISVSVHNTSDFAWIAVGDHAVHFAYHWLDKEGKVVVFDGVRTNLKEDLPVGGTEKLSATILAPSAPGDYTLRLTMVEEGVAWFNDRGAKAVDLPVKVASK